MSDELGDLRKEAGRMLYSKANGLLKNLSRNEHQTLKLACEVLSVAATMDALNLRWEEQLRWRASKAKSTLMNTGGLQQTHENY